VVEFKGPHIEIEHPLVVDRLSVVMALIIGIIGGIISIYSLGYMRDFHEHNPKEYRDKRCFFFLLFLHFLERCTELFFRTTFAGFISSGK
jgi:ech hydrogenase subunit A